MGKKIYDSEFRCCGCRDVIGEYSSKNRQRVVKSWASICFQCLKKKDALERRSE